MNNIKRFFLLLSLFAGSANVIADTGSAIKVSHAWVREPPPMISMTAVYMALENRSDKSRKVVGVTSSSFDEVDMHRTVVNDGVASMRMQPSIVLQPGETLEFEKTGYHLMPSGAHSKITLGQKIQFVLEMGNGEKVPFEAVVKRPGGAMPGHEHHH